ncbi:MAG: hypothetical protein FJ265_08110 [Planctomycetes bacterium]|nr:hypothetical protein [Planctomycetota bacterium]
MELGTGRVIRSFGWLERDHFGQPMARRGQVALAMAFCARGHRIRVLPCDMLRFKRYALSLIEHEVAAYLAGDVSLRQVAWSLHGEPTPQHTTLHAWTEGLGAHVLGRDAVAGEPHTAMVAETLARWPEVATATTTALPAIDSRRYRSEARRERLAAVALLLAMAAAVLALRDSASRLTAWRGLAIGFGVTSPLSFRTGRPCTAIEQAVTQTAASCRAWPRPTRRSPPNRTRSPPGASRSSARSSIPPSDTRSAGA